MDAIKVILTSLLSVGTLFVVAKILGHKQIAQLDIFDYITGITIGSIGAELATELEAPWKPLLAMIVYGGVTLLLSVISCKFSRSRKYINGTPTIIFHNGKFFRGNMKKAKLELSEFMMMCRQLGYFKLDQVQTAVFEFNGKLSILPKALNRPATPLDLNLSPEEEMIYAEVIMDGEILEENLKRMGVNSGWLNKEIKNQGFKSPKEIFLGLCDQKKNLMLFETEKQI